MDTPTRICTYCGATTLLVQWDELSELCVPCYNAWCLEIEQAQHVTIARELVRYYNLVLAGIVKEVPR